MLGLLHPHMAPGHTPGLTLLIILLTRKRQNALTVANLATVRQNAHQTALVTNRMQDITVQAILYITTIIIAYFAVDLYMTCQTAEQLMHHSAPITSSMVMTLLTVELAEVLIKLPQ